MRRANSLTFRTENAARKALENVRWPQGPVCPHCADTNHSLIGGTKKSHRPGLYYCHECGGQFSVTVGTVLERSKIPLTKWWLAAELFSSREGGCSARDIQRRLRVSYKTAWFMIFRLREANNNM